MAEGPVPSTEYCFFAPFMLEYIYASREPSCAIMEVITRRSMKKILLLVHTAQTRPGHLNWVAFRDALQQRFGKGAAIEMSAVSQLTFVLDGSNARIYDAKQQFDIRNFDLVVFRTIGNQSEPAIAVAAYCRKLGIPYIDSYIPEIGATKLSCAFVRWEHDLPVPSTYYGPDEELLAIARWQQTWPWVVKADNGKKGRDNFLVHSLPELEEVFVKNPEVRFVMQTFIPNDGDFRVLVFNNKARMVILRRGSGDSHLNNTSQGGTATQVPLQDLPDGVVDLAVRAAKLERLAIAGVDIIIDKQTNKLYILEVNRAPQIPTGAFADEKLTQYVEALKELLIQEKQHEKR